MAKKNSPGLTPDPEGDLALLEKAVEAKQGKEPVSGELSKHIATVFMVNQQNFKRVRQDMVRLLRRVKGEYDPQKLTAIKAFRGSETYLRNCENKSRAATSWIEDIYRGDVDIPWMLEPTAIADLPDETTEQIKLKTQTMAGSLVQRLADANLQIPPDEVAKLVQDYYDEELDKAMEDMQNEAKERCERASLLIRDQNQEGGWDRAFKDFLYYFVRLKFAIIKGPILTKKTKQVWKYTPETGAEMVAEEQLVTDCYCVSPFNFFPSKGMKNINDGDTIEIHDLTLDSLHRMIGVPGYSDIELRAVISRFQAGKIKSRWFVIDDENEVKRVTQETKNDRSIGYGSSTAGENATELAAGAPTTILAQEFYGTVSGRLLIDWGSKEKDLDPQRQYHRTFASVPFVVSSTRTL